MNFANTHRQKSSFPIIIQKYLLEAIIHEPRNTEITGTISSLSFYMPKRKPYELFEISLIYVALNQENKLDQNI